MKYMYDLHIMNINLTFINHIVGRKIRYSLPFPQQSTKSLTCMSKVEFPEYIEVCTMYALRLNSRTLLKYLNLKIP